jgi:hypothetical protein
VLWVSGAIHFYVANAENAAGVSLNLNQASATAKEIEASVG